MSDYGAYDEPRRYRTTRTRPRERGEPEYMEETTFIERGKGPPPRELAYPRARKIERQESIEEIHRDFPPPEARRPRYRDDYDQPPPRRAKSQAGRRNDHDDYDDYGPPVAAGAAAGYAAGRARRGGDRDRDRDRDQYSERRGGRGRNTYYSDDQSPPPRRERRKSQSGLEKTLEVLGLGGVVGAITGNSGNSRGRDDRDRGYGSDRSRSRSRGHQKERQWAQAAQAAIVAGAVEAFRARNEPGPWTGEKGRKIATAAIAAGGIDRLVDRNPNEKSKRHLAEAVLGGLAANRLANGPTNKDGADGERGRSRSRSRSVLDRFRSKSRGGRDSSSEEEKGGQRNGLKDLAAGGALAAVGKALYDRFEQNRSKSRGGGNRRRSPSSSSDDSYVPSRNRRRDVGASQSRDFPPPPRNSNETAVAARAPQNRGREREGNKEVKKRGGSRSSSSSSASDTDLEKRRKKMRGKEYLTAALASVATIHAAHGVYASMESSDKRHKLVSEGEMSVEEARKKRSKAWLQDAAAIGIAALGIKGAYSEWKEMNEQRHEMKELEERRERREKRRKKREREQQKFGSGGGGGGRYGPPPGTGAPYYAGNVPPPPMGYPSNGTYR